MNRNTRNAGIGIYILVGMMLIFLIFAFRDRFNGRSDITEQQLSQMLEDGEVSHVEIVQNEEVPTGSLLVTTTKNEVRSVNVTDVNAAKARLEKYDISITRTMCPAGELSFPISIRLG